MNGMSERVKQARPNRSEVGNYPSVSLSLQLSGFSCGSSMSTGKMLAAAYAQRRSLQNGSLLKQAECNQRNVWIGPKHCEAPSDRFSLPDRLLSYLSRQPFCIHVPTLWSFVAGTIKCFIDLGCPVLYMRPLPWKSTPPMKRLTSECWQQHFSFCF